MNTPKQQRRKDPDGMNEARADRASVVIAAYCEIPGTDDDADSVLTDIITDIMHYCDANDLDFGKHLRIAHYHYEAETETTLDWQLTFNE